MAWHQTGDKPLPKSVSQFTDIKTSPGLNELMTSWRVNHDNDNHHLHVD